MNKKIIAKELKRIGELVSANVHVHPKTAGNMGHCRFENTSGDLEDCLEHLDDDLGNSSYEMEGRRRLVQLCKQIARRDPNDWDNQKSENE